jgi:hypothetical protein
VSVRDPEGPGRRRRPPHDRDPRSSLDVAVEVGVDIALVKNTAFSAPRSVKLGAGRC